VASTSGDFDAASFRDAIRFVYTMAAAPVSEDQVYFHFESVLVYNVPVDQDGRPFDPDATVVRTTPTAVQVPCAVEYVDAENQPTSFGLLSPSKVKITLLDQDYALVKDAIYVVIAGDRYNYRRTFPPSGLFDVGLFDMLFVAENET
jgi:hypothetical protein